MLKVDEIIRTTYWLFIKDRKTKAKRYGSPFFQIGQAHTLKRFLSIIGGICLVLVVVVVVAGFVGYAAYQGRGLDASSKAYVEENIPAIRFYLVKG